jgi:hypothetical protein
MINNNNDSDATHKTKVVGRHSTRKATIKEENKQNEIIPTSFDENDTTNFTTTTDGNKYWKELYAVLSSFGLVLLSYAILLYLLSYEKSECPPTPSVSSA